jgi:hypothetical protein
MSIDTEIEESMRVAAEQKALATGTRLEEEAAAEEEAVFTRARAAAEAEQGVLPEKYQGKSAAEVFALMKAEQEYLLTKAKEGEPAEEGEEEAPEGEAEETPEEEESEAVTALREASEEFYANEGKIKPETLAKLEALDSKELLQSYLKLQAENVPEAPITDEQAVALVKSVGGQETYNKALEWAAENLSPEDQATYDKVIASRNPGATKFAVEALLARYKAAEGFDGEPVSGTKAKNQGVKPYRSNAELRRDLGNPRYQEDPAFRLDVETRLAASGELLD